MADYIYLLENRLSKAQQNAISAVREIARTKGLTVFLVGGAVRDLTSGSPVRDLDVAVQGNALKLKKDLEKAGAVVTGESEAGQALFARFPGNVRIEIGSTLSAHFPKPGKPVLKAATILEDLRRRDFTANAMALSLNQGSYGLLMDPLNGVADIENRELRLVSNYGFIEDPVRMIRSQRFSARLGWQLEEKTQSRYETGKAEGYISALSDFLRGYETEELVHEEDPLRVMRRLEAEGWLKVLAPAWGSAKVNVVELEKLREAQAQLQMQGIHADPSAAQFPLLTAKLTPKDVADLKKSFPRKGFVTEIEALEGEAKQFASELGSKQAATPSTAWKMLMSARPEVVLWVAYSTKSAALKAKFDAFYKEWPQARLKIPYTLMQEMRIVPELAGYDELVDKLFFELMDGKLSTVEEMKAFLEPYSPPAPPPPVHLRRARATKKDSKAKSRKKADAAEEPVEDADLAAVAAAALAGLEHGDTEVEEADPDSEEADDDEDSDSATHSHANSKSHSTQRPTASPQPVAAKPAPAKTVPAKAVVAKAPPVKAPVAAKSVSAKALAKKAVPTKAPAKKSAPVKLATKALSKQAPAKRAPAKAPSKSAPKPVGAKVATKKAVPARPAAKKAPAKSVVKKAVAKKTTTKPSAKPAGKTPAAKPAAKGASKAPAKKKR
jgi:tRNA nucleotidyltransferase/poly(A) polymerase